MNEERFGSLVWALAETCWAAVGVSVVGSEPGGAPPFVFAFARFANADFS
jgi:hypothetical protein